MTDKWLEEKWMDLEEQKQRIAKNAKELKKRGTGAIFRSSGINWKILGIIGLIIVVIISFVSISTAVRSIFLVIGFLLMFILVINVVRGKVKFGFRGWLTLGIIAIVGLAFLGTNVRMNLTLSLSDVQPKTHGWRFTTGDTMYYCDKSQDTLNYYTTSALNPLLDPGNTIYSRVPIAYSCYPSTIQSWKMDMDNERNGMPNIGFEIENMYPSDSTGSTIDDFEFNDFPVNDDITLVQTFVKIVVTLEFTTDQPYMEVDKFILEYFFTVFDGEFYLEYITKGDNPDSPKYIANTGGQRVTGEFAFGVETGKIKWTADEELPEAEFISTAVIGAELFNQENSWARMSGTGGELNGVHPNDWGANGNYEVGHMGRQLLYRNTWDCLQQVDPFDDVPIGDKNYQDEFVPEVYMSIPFDVLMGGVWLQGGDLAETDEVYWISRYTSRNTFLVEVVSAYNLNIDGGIPPIVVPDPDPPPDPNPLLDLWNQISGWVIDFWQSAWYGKVILIAVPVILVGSFGGVGISKSIKKEAGKTRVGGAVSQAVNVVVGEGNKIPATIKKTTKRAGRKAKGLFRKLKRRFR